MPIIATVETKSEVLYSTKYSSRIDINNISCIYQPESIFQEGGYFFSFDTSEALGPDYRLLYKDPSHRVTVNLLDYNKDCTVLSELKASAIDNKINLNIHYQSIKTATKVIFANE